MFKFFRRKKKRNMSPDRASPPPLMKTRSEEQLNYFYNELNQHGTIEEYKRAKEQVFVKHELLEYSPLQSILSELKRKIEREPFTQSFSQFLLQLMATAFELPDVNDARSYRCIDGYHLFPSIGKLHNMLEWRKDLLFAALRHVERTEGATQMGPLLSLLAVGGESCEARRMMAFHAAVLRCKIDIAIDDALEVEETEKQKARRQLWEAATDYVESVKVRAFQRVFIDPTHTCLHQLGCMTRDDADVHGGNTYSALLFATLAIMLPRGLFLQDEAKGVCDYLRPPETRQEALMAVSPKDSFKSFKMGFQRGSLMADYFIFPGRTPLDVAKRAISRRAEDQDGRKHLSLYLEAFTRYFTKEEIIQPLFLHLSGEGQALNVILKDLYPDEKVEDVREWVYDVEKDYEFSEERAVLLLRHAGVAE
ncbi:hypothetical protein PROFUN_07646 [Planoprotostelium fungivorum]|uniref:Uncharacterized protein n=1 Tax=Planoprotostelium fungivorum TaxID=1890364 RepID=A0A2P6NK49_9EUKA|nr:hypothetical protein PROFUN_07646 [Planoprotostelium fungivorum]